MCEYAQLNNWPHYLGQKSDWIGFQNTKSLFFLTEIQPVSAPSVTRTLSLPLEIAAQSHFFLIAQFLAVWIIFPQLHSESAISSMKQ